MNIIELNDKLSRIEIPCRIDNKNFLMWIDTGASNTLMSANAHKLLKLYPHGGMTYSGKVAGVEFKEKHSLTIPKIEMPGCTPLKNIRAIVALDGDEWERIILLGLNVLNHLTFKINRDPMPGTFEWLESLTSKVPGSSRTRFDHLVFGGKYLLADDNKKELY